MGGVTVESGVGPGPGGGNGEKAHLLGQEPVQLQIPAQGQAHRCRSFLVVDAQSPWPPGFPAGTIATSSPSRYQK